MRFPHLRKAGTSRATTSAIGRDAPSSDLALRPSATGKESGFAISPTFQRYARLLKAGRVSPVDFRERLPYPADIKELARCPAQVIVTVIDLNDFHRLPNETVAAFEKWIQRRVH